MMKKRILLISIACFFTAFVFAQNPIMKETYNTISSGKLVGVSDYSSQEELRAVKISISDLISMMDDYKRISSYPGSNFAEMFQNIEKLIREIESKERVISDLQKKVDYLEQKISDLDRRIK